jgi:GR25 family glycosyltransferase involved in LPS biosynthesis
LSHAAVIASEEGTSDSFLILEDDACFGPETFTTLDRLLETTKDHEWDILFTDVVISNAPTMAELVILRNELKPFGRVITLDLRRLSGLPFAGATAYLVNYRSAHKLSAFLKPASLDLPYDLLLKTLVAQGKITAHVTFPFLTTVSRDSSASSIQGDTINRFGLIIDTFRRMVWIRGDDFDPSSDLEIIKKGLDNRSLDFGLLWASMIDPTFAPQRNALSQSPPGGR